MGKQILFIKDPGVATGPTDSEQTQEGKGPNKERQLILSRQLAKKYKSNKERSE